MAFYCHFIKKGFKPEYLFDLPIHTKMLFAAVMNQEIEEKNKYTEIQNELLKNSEGVTPTLSVQI